MLVVRVDHALRGDVRLKQIERGVSHLDGRVRRLARDADDGVGRFLELRAEITLLEELSSRYR